MLLSILNELPQISGKIQTNGRIAYVEDRPVIFPGTIRSNITFGRPFDQKKYDEILTACLLSEPLGHFLKQDQTEVMERGKNLSESMKMKISLARALYFEADIYLLDDPFLIFENKMGNKLFQEIVLERLKGRTVVLATSLPLHAKFADRVIFLEFGMVKFDGSYQELLQHQISKTLGITHHQKRRKTLTRRRASTKSRTAHAIESANSNPGIKFEENMKNLHQPTENEEELQVANLDKEEFYEYQIDESPVVTGHRVYIGSILKYIDECFNYLPLLIFILAAITVDALAMLFNVRLGYFSQQDPDNTDSIGVLWRMLLGVGITAFGNAFIFLWLHTNASNKLHSKLMDCVIRSKLQFFNESEASNLMERFTHDLDIMELAFPKFFKDVLTCFIYIIALMITTSIYTPMLLLPSGILLLAFVMLYWLSKRALLDAASLESTAKPATISVINFCLDGLMTLQTYFHKDSFLTEVTKIADQSLRAYLAFNSTMKFFNFWIDMITILYAIIQISIVVLMAGDNEPGIIGISIVLILEITSCVYILHKQLIFCILLSSSSNQIMKLFNIETEPPLIAPIDYQLVKSHWPQTGELEFRNVFLKYKRDMNYALKSVRLRIADKEKVACIAANGIGHQALVHLLFRVYDLDKWAAPGSKVKVGGMDVELLGLHLLRQSISYLPKEPLIFADTLRNNLDPFDAVSEGEVWRSIKIVGLENFVANLDNGINSDISQLIPRLSSKEAHLISLARALLQKNKIMVINDIFALLDEDAEHQIQQVINEYFQDHTILTVTSKLNAIAGYDKVIVIDRGRIAEFDSPYKLLVKDPNDTFVTNKNSIFAKMLMNTNENIVKAIFEVCRVKYFSDLEEAKEKQQNMEIVS
mgnify:CR=1 FL=1